MCQIPRKQAMTSPVDFWVLNFLAVESLHDAIPCLFLCSQVCSDGPFSHHTWVWSRNAFHSLLWCSKCSEEISALHSFWLNVSIFGTHLTLTFQMWRCSWMIFSILPALMCHFLWDFAHRNESVVHSKLVNFVSVHMIDCCLQHEGDCSLSQLSLNAVHHTYTCVFDSASSPNCFKSLVNISQFWAFLTKKYDYTLLLHLLINLCVCHPGVWLSICASMLNVWRNM